MIRLICITAMDLKKSKKIKPISRISNISPYLALKRYDSSMKNTPKFMLELVFTVFIGLILSGAFELVLQSFALSNGKVTQWSAGINATAGVLFGLIIGYKLNSLIRTHKSWSHTYVHGSKYQ